MQRSQESEPSGQPADQDSMPFPGIVAPVATGGVVGAAQSAPAVTEDGTNESGKGAPAEAVSEVEVAKPVPKRRRGRPRKVKSEGEQIALDVNAMTRVTQEATQASAIIHEPPVATLAEADANLAEVASKRHRKKRAGSLTPSSSEQDDGAQASEAGADDQDASRQAHLEEGQSQDERVEGGRQRRGRRERKDDATASGGSNANNNGNAGSNGNGGQRGSRRSRRNPLSRRRRWRKARMQSRAASPSPRRTRRITSALTTNHRAARRASRWCAMRWAVRGTSRTTRRCPRA